MTMGYDICVMCPIPTQVPLPTPLDFSTFVNRITCILDAIKNPHVESAIANLCTWHHAYVPINTNTTQ
jgi:hypothetical protein